MHKEFLWSAGSWASILGLLISVGTLLMALNIKGKIEQSLRKKQYQQQQGRILSSIKQIRDGIYAAQEYDRPVREYPSQTILNIRELVLQLYYFKLWKRSEERRMRNFVKLLEQSASKASKATAKDLVMAMDEIIAIVESHAEL